VGDSPVQRQRAQRHALLFRRLVEACGGIPAIVDQEATRLCKPSQLYRFCDATSGQFAPMDVIEDLELLCGQPIVTAALAEALPRARTARELRREACEASAALGDLMHLVLEAGAAKGGLSPRLKAAIIKACDHVSAEIRDVREAALQDGSVDDGRVTA